MYYHLSENFAKINRANGPANVKVKIHLGNHLCGNVDLGE